MTTLATVREKIQRLLYDTDGTSFTEELITDAIEAAYVAILPWIPKSKVETFAGDGAVLAFSLPTDFYRVVAILDAESGLYVPQDAMKAMSSPGARTDLDLEWSLFPEGYLTFSRAPLGDVVLTYGAQWTTPVEETDVLEVPFYVMNGILMYACSWALNQKASSTSNIRQFNIKVDSGTPVMNPMKDMANHFMQRFELEMNRIPTRVKGSQL